MRWPGLRVLEGRFREPLLMIMHPPYDQVILDSRSSTHNVSKKWVMSHARQTLALEHSDEEQGMLGLRPSWGEIVALARKDPRLAHLAPQEPLAPVASGS